MKINADAFTHQLSQAKLAPGYWLCGDEPLQQQEARQALFNKAMQAGFSSHQRLDAKSIDESLLLAELYAGSLLAPKQIIEINLAQGKLVESLANVMQIYCQKPNPHVLLILTSPKLEASTANSKAYKAFDNIGVIVPCWPITLEQLPKWFAERLAKYQLSTSLSGLKLLAELTEGNLLYAAQSIEKLALLYPAPQSTPLTVEQILHAVAPQAVFDSFQLNDAFLNGDKTRALLICRSLKATGNEVILVWGALLREVRLLIKLQQLQTEKNFAEASQKLGLWEKRKPLYRKVLQRRINANMLKVMANIDQCIKNHHYGDPWLAIERFILRYG